MIGNLFICRCPGFYAIVGGITVEKFPLGERFSHSRVREVNIDIAGDVFGGPDNIIWLAGNKRLKSIRLDNLDLVIRGFRKYGKIKSEKCS